MNNRILLVEDDRSIAEHLAEYLGSEGFSTKHAPGQETAEKLLSENQFDLVLLDITLADGNGYSLCTAIKKQYGLPVIFLTASGDEFSVVTGLDMGADDYISKPFRPRELVSRIRSVMRRTGHSSSIIENGELKIDTEKASVTQKGCELFLSALEYRLLLVFMTNRGNVLSRERLLEELWDAAGEYVNDNTLSVYIKRLREKIEDDPQNPRYIKTVRGLGYRCD